MAEKTVRDRKAGSFVYNGLLDLLPGEIVLMAAVTVCIHATALQLQWSIRGDTWM